MYRVRVKMIYQMNFNTLNISNQNMKITDALITIVTSRWRPLHIEIGRVR